MDLTSHSLHGITFPLTLRIQTLTKIVRRDFFPDVPKLEAQLEFIEASEANDYERLRAISERFPTTQRTPQPAGGCGLDPSHTHSHAYSLIHTHTLICPLIYSFQSPYEKGQVLLARTS